MIGVTKDFTNCNAFLYDDKGDLLANVKIMEHNIIENYIVVLDTVYILTNKQSPLTAGTLCDVLIPMAPIPYAYKGRIQKGSDRKRIMLFDQAEKESRKETRYKVDVPATIEGLFYDGEYFALRDNLKARLINISKGGMRFSSVPNALALGNTFQIRMRIGDNDKVLTAAVVFYKEFPPDTAEYGCCIVNLEGS
jgi:c-di-GMP-binding flagellar brake protein YcgR